MSLKMYLNPVFNLECCCHLLLWKPFPRGHWLAQRWVKPLYSLPCILTLPLRQKHCKHCNYQDRYLWVHLMACAVCPTSLFVFAEIQRSQGNAVFPPQCFPPLLRFNNNSNSLWACTNTQFRKALHVNPCREVNFLVDTINWTIFFILIKLQIIYQRTSFLLPHLLHAAPTQDWLIPEAKGKTKIKLPKQTQKAHCIAAKHILQRALKAISSTGKKKKNPKPWDWNSYIHGQEIIHKTCQKWAEKLHSQTATCNSPDCFFITALDNDQTRKSIRWHMKEALQRLHLSVSYFMGLFEFSQLLSSK